RRCLEKSRRLRLRDIGEARIALSEPIPETGARESRGDRVKEPPRRSSAVRVGLAVVLLSTIAWMGTRWAASTRSPALMRFSAVTNSPGVDAQPSLSSDGRSLAFVSNRDGQFDLWVRLIAGGRLLQITNDRNLDADPRFSADGSQIAFSKLSDTGRWDIWVVSALGGEPRLVIPNAKGPDWSPDCRSLAYADLRTATIWLADASGAHARAITQHEPGARHYTQRRPAFSHDGRHVAFERRTGGPFVDLGIVDLETGRQSALTNETRLAASPAWSS